MDVQWKLQVLLAVVLFAVSSHGTVEIKYQTRLITPDDDLGGGRVEVYQNGQWGTICDENWGKEEAEVVCKELGYSRAMFAYKKAHSGEGTGPIFLSNVNCDGTESSIIECAHDGWGVTGSCTHKDDAGVRCIKSDIPELEYLGCWIDNPIQQRILPDFYLNLRGKGGLDWHNLGEAVLKCAYGAFNNSKDYNLFAVQYFGECYSAEGNPDYKKMKAAPNACVYGVGEKSHNAVYGFGNYSNLGCWKDMAGNRRTMTLLKNFRGTGFIDWNDMSKTVKACYKEAKDAEMTYFAVQFYGECWASKSETFRDYGQVTSCHNGVGEQWSNYVYQIRA